MSRREPLPLGGWLLISIFVTGYFAISLFSGTTLLWQGVTTKGVIFLDEKN